MKKLLNYLAYVANLALASVLVYVLLENLFGSNKDYGVAIMAAFMASVCVEAVYYRMKYNTEVCKVERG